MLGVSRGEKKAAHWSAAVPTCPLPSLSNPGSLYKRIQRACCSLLKENHRQRVFQMEGCGTSESV